MKNLTLEIKRVLFYIIYTVVMLIMKKISPSGAHFPGLGDFLFFLILPVSVIFFFIDLYKYYKEPIKSRLRCLLIHSLIWLFFYLCLKFNIL